MAFITKATDRHYAIRMTRSELNSYGMEANPERFNVKEFIELASNKDEDIKCFVENVRKNQQAIILLAFDSNMEETSEDIIFTLFTIDINRFEEDTEKMIFILKISDTPDHIKESVAILLEAIEMIINEVLNRDFEESKDIRDTIGDDVYYWIRDQFGKNNDDDIDDGECHFESDSLDIEAICNGVSLSFQTISGKQLQWFHNCIKKLGLSNYESVFIKNGTFCVLIDISNLTTRQIAKVLMYASESGIELLPNLSNISLLEHETPLTEETILFVGESNIILRGKCV